MTDQHSITPPLELREQWYASADDNCEDVIEVVAIQAARWGADQELEACCSEIGFITTRATANSLRSLRRPKPPSLKEQALESLTKIEDNKATYLDASIVRSALEALPNN